MDYPRSSGILLHPTSLPGPYGIGDIGPAALTWIDQLAKAGCSLWQVLPLGPTGYGDSPYQCFSAFAGNPYLVSPEALLTDGLLEPEDLADLPQFPEHTVDFGAVIPWKLAVLDRSYARFKQASSAARQEFEDFQAGQAQWLDDFAVFMALKDAHEGQPWSTWETSLRSRQPEALAKFRARNAEAIERHTYRQFLFFKQWDRLHQHARRRGVSIIGDAPIFVAHDSADVWAHPELFFLTERGKPEFVAGVPPDYFSPTGQLWGNPLYRWDVHKESGYAWWIERLRAVLSLVDILRLDHFRGFSAYWKVKGTAQTAAKGVWETAPGMDFFVAVQNALGELPIIAEDLGVITPDVVAMREAFGLPGMKIVLFAFTLSFGGGPQDAFMPHHYPRHCVAYTGTHDNDTARGWYERVSEEERDFYRRYTARSGENVSWDMIRAVWGSTAMMALAPMQDFLSLGNEARMNYPGNPSGNWNWRMTGGQASSGIFQGIREYNFLYDRLNPQTAADEAAAREPQAQSGEMNPQDEPDVILE